MTSAASPPGTATQGMTTPGTAPHERVFPADASQVGAARAFLSAILAGGPAAEAAVLCVSELATNAITHSRSREPGGSFTVRVQPGGQRVRVEVSDQGGPWHPRGRASTDDPTGRGLQIVGQLAARWGCAGHSRQGWTVWFEMEPGQ
jgi:serine/threonine-protein kinase RsbW